MNKQTTAPETREKRRSGKRKLIICIAALVLALCVAATVYFSVGYSADETARQALQSGGSVTVTETGGWYFFDGKGTDTALVFYQGAKVDCEAYAPLMRQLADGGVDCFLLKLPLRIAFFDGNAADKVIGQYDYAHWILAGHSLGGVTAAGYCAKHADSVDGLVLLASYANERLSAPLHVLSIYGSEDGVLNRDKYEEARRLLPTDNSEIVIQGGNHAGFGCYGEQRGDNPATVSAAEQQAQTAGAILLWAQGLGGSPWAVPS